VTEEVLFDNARALVVDHDRASRTVVFNERLKAFAKHWGFLSRACAPGGQFRMSLDRNQ
jgi:transposase